MKREEISEEQYNKILECFLESMVKGGLKGTRMDLIASSLQMSKRTLYEIFNSKEDLFFEAHRYFHKKMGLKLSEIFLSSANVMEGIIRCFLYQRDLMSNLSAEFIRDMQEFAKNFNHVNSEKARQHYQHFYEILKKGKEEGYFRSDLNLLIQCRMLTLQMEALKRTQEIFPEDISLLEIYDNIIVGFLRSISSDKGLAELEKYMPNLTHSFQSNHDK